MSTNTSNTEATHPNPLAGDFGRDCAIEISEPTPPSVRRRRPNPGRVRVPGASAWLRLRTVCAVRLLLLLLLLTLPAAVLAQFHYRVDNGSIIITGYTCSEGVVTIPSTINGLPVTSIGVYAFSGCTRLISVTIPNSVTSIEDGAFFVCTSLTSVTIPDSVASIGGGAFSGCTSLTSVTIPNSVTSIGQEAFSGCASLSAITVEALNSFYSSVDGVLFVNSQTTLLQYPGGKAGRYTIPNSVTSIGLLAFDDCTRLSAITVEALNSFYSSVDGVLFDKSQATLIQYPGGRTGSYTIPNSVTSIGDSAFRHCTSLTNVKIGNSVTSIVGAAFQFCTRLTSVTIPNSVTSIAGFAFSGCTSLSAITVEALNSSYSSVDGVLFDKCQFTLIQYPGGKAGIYTIPNSVTSVGFGAFGGCTGLTRITIPNSVTSIEDGAFPYCTRLTSVTIPNSVTSIGGGAFYGCTSLTSVTIPNSVTTIGQEAFSGCTSLTSITIGNSVTSIGDFAFEGCTSLTEVYFKGNAPRINSLVFSVFNKAIVYYLPGTIGWTSIFAGRPARRWKPLVQTSDSTFGVRTNQFGFTLTWASDKVIVVEASTDLTDPIWSPVGTNTLTGGSSYFSDPQ